jgi:fibronectin type 3 domain-containing protein
MKNKFGRLAIIALALSLCAIVYAQQQHTVLVSWTASNCNGASGCTATVGYYVYRATNPAGPFALLNVSPVTGTSYVDSTVINGNDYYYEAVAVDASGGTSIPSNVTNVVVVPGNPAPPSGCMAVVQNASSAVSRKSLPVPKKKN